MPLNTRYQELECYLRLKPEHQTCLNKLIEAYAKKLTGPLHVGNSFFTPHDFNHHCYNLYRIISRNLCDISIGIDRSRHLSEFELFLLDIAVLFHDYGMSTIAVLDVERENHAKKSAELLEEQWENPDSTLYVEGQEVSMTKNDIDVVGAIIKAHSDEKGPGAPKETGIFDRDLLEEMPSSDTEPVRAKLLAGILRLADELDITSDRIGDTRLLDQLDRNNDEHRVSYRCWNNLRYFKTIKNDPQIPTQLNLVVDDKEVRRQLENGDEEVVLSGIKQVADKVNREFAVIRDEIFRKTAINRAIIRVETIEIVSGIDEVNRYLRKAEEASGGPGRDLMVVAVEGGVRLGANALAEGASHAPEGKAPVQKQKNVELLPGTAQQELDRFILKQKLVETGHFHMDSMWCARDWVNMSKIAEDPEILETCIRAMARHIRKNMSLENTVILGIDLNGTLMGVRIAAELMCPFQMLLPPKEPDSPDRRKIDLTGYEHVIYITDVVTTGVTIADITEHYSLEGKVLGTYALLYRKPLICNASDSSHRKRTADEKAFQFSTPLYCISDTFRSEVIKRDECVWKDRETGCIACNKVIK